MIIRNRNSVKPISMYPVILKYFTNRGIILHICIWVSTLYRSQFILCPHISGKTYNPSWNVWRGGHITINMADMSVCHVNITR